MGNITPKTPGNPNRRRLTDAEEVYVYCAVATGESTKEELAVRFGVHYETIRNIMKRQANKAREAGYDLSGESK